MVYQQTNNKGQSYFLHKKRVILKGSGVTRDIYYFSRSAGSDAIDKIPSGFNVVENPKTGLLFLKKAS